MKKREFFIALFLHLTAICPAFSKSNVYLVKSPDQRIVVNLEVGHELKWSIKSDSNSILLPSVISLELSSGKILGREVEVVKFSLQKVVSSFATPVYKKSTVIDIYNLLTLSFKGGYGLQIRVYDDGAAYRFTSKDPREFEVVSERADFNFESDHKIFIPYVRDLRVKDDRYVNSFESLYDQQKLSELYPDSLAFLPLLIDFGDELKATILDVNLENYPGLLVVKGIGNSLNARFAGYPVHEGWP